MHTFFSFEKNVSYIEFAFHSKNPQINYTVKLGVSKKTEKPIKPRKPEKNNRINRTELNSNRKKLEKIEPKPSQTEKTDPNRFESVVVQKKPNRTKISRFEPVLVQFRFFFKKKFGLVIFFYKNRTNRK
jgi:hypothetical protein